MIYSNECYLKDSCNKYKNGGCTDDFCIKLFRVNTLFDKSLLSDKQRVKTPLYVDSDGADKDNFERLREIECNISAFVGEGRNLYIHSPITGNGKTEWAIRLIQSYIMSTWHETTECNALFINVPRFLLSMKDSISNRSEYVDHIRENVLDVDLVVWDEIGIKTLTQFEHENLLNLVNTRLDWGKSNIYTSNLSNDELKEKLGDRLYSRILGMSEEIIFKGKDKRGLSV